MGNIQGALYKAKIKIKEPNIKSLNDKYLVFDMHVHTRFSDTFTKVKDLLKKAEEMGIGIAITDHNEIGGILRAIELKSKVPIIPGIEVSINEGPHILVYFYNIEELKDFYYNHFEHFKKKNPHTNTDMTIAELHRVTRNFNCIVSIAHPHAPAYANIPRNIVRGFIDPKYLKDFDAVEVINGAVTNKMNKKAIEFAENINLGITGGSDSHSLFELGKVVTYTNASNIKDFLDKVKEKKTFVVGSTIGQIQRTPSLAKSTQKHMSYWVSTIPLRYEQMFSQTLRYHTPRVIYKIGSIKESGVEVIKNPISKVVFPIMKKINGTMHSIKNESIELIKDPKRLPKTIKVAYKPIVVAVNGTFKKTINPQRKNYKKKDDYYYLKQ